MVTRIRGFPSEFQRRKAYGFCSLFWCSASPCCQRYSTGLDFFSSASLIFVSVFLFLPFWMKLVVRFVQNMVFDTESKSVLHTEMAKKNLFVKRGENEDGFCYICCLLVMLRSRWKWLLKRQERMSIFKYGIFLIASKLYAEFIRFV